MPFVMCNQLTCTGGSKWGESNAFPDHYITRNLYLDVEHFGRDKGWYDIPEAVESWRHFTITKGVAEVDKAMLTVEGMGGLWLDGEYLAKDAPPVRLQHKSTIELRFEGEGYLAYTFCDAERSNWRHNLECCISCSKSPAPLMCSACLATAYCSEACRAEEKTIHKRTTCCSNMYKRIAFELVDSPGYEGVPGINQDGAPTVFFGALDANLLLYVVEFLSLEDRAALAFTSSSTMRTICENTTELRSSAFLGPARPEGVAKYTSRWRSERAINWLYCFLHRVVTLGNKLEVIDLHVEYMADRGHMLYILNILELLLREDDRILPLRVLRLGGLWNVNNRNDPPDRDKDGYDEDGPYRLDYQSSDEFIKALFNLPRKVAVQMAEGNLPNLEVVSLYTYDHEAGDTSREFHHTMLFHRQELQSDTLACGLERLERCDGLEYFLASQWMHPKSPLQRQLTFRNLISLDIGNLLQNFDLLLREKDDLDNAYEAYDFMCIPQFVKIVTKEALPNVVNANMSIMGFPNEIMHFFRQLLRERGLEREPRESCRGFCALLDGLERVSFGSTCMGLRGEYDDAQSDWMLEELTSAAELWQDLPRSLRMELGMAEVRGQNEPLRESFPILFSSLVHVVLLHPMPSPLFFTMLESKVGSGGCHLDVREVVYCSHPDADDGWDPAIEGMKWLQAYNYGSATLKIKSLRVRRSDMFANDAPKTNGGVYLEEVPAGQEFYNRRLDAALERGGDPPEWYPLKSGLDLVGQVALPHLQELHVPRKAIYDSNLDVSWEGLLSSFFDERNYHDLVPLHRLVLLEEGLNEVSTWNKTPPYRLLEQMAVQCDAPSHVPLANCCQYVDFDFASWGLFMDRFRQASKMMNEKMHMRRQVPSVADPMGSVRAIVGNAFFYLSLFD